MSVVSRFSTEVTKRLGIAHPIICGGMHNVTYAPFAAAVSNSGALGMITALTQPSAEALRQEIRKAKELTDKPFGVNLTLLPVMVPPDYDAYANVVVEEGIKVVETAGHYKGLEPFVKLFKDNDITIIHKCTSIRHATSGFVQAVDMVTIDGFEAAGHPGETDIGGFVLFARAAQELTIPWLACGGMATGGQLAAALALGAEGIVLGTRMMATQEAPIHDNVKQALLNGKETDTTLIMRSMRNTERVYKNKAAEEVLAIEKEHPGEFDRVRHLVSGKVYKEVFETGNKLETAVFSCGNSMGLIKDIPTCHDLVNNMTEEAHHIITGKLQNISL